ncbi:hypothetical protein [Pseudonocardia pini]|uniref:hypothetical protein n=1 Tax=Pseudonocardia pini TaxID=2758030 RepID=UPI0015F055F3|nr:hypothetical protein [Pseudonocardia pini]
MTTGAATRTAPSGLVTALRVTAVLAVLVIVVQGVTAGEILGQSRSAEMLHNLGAYGVHAFTGLAMIAAVLVVRATGARPWPAVLAAVVFVVTFPQAALGSYGVMVVHVPLAMVLLVGSVWVLVWSFTGTRG